MGYSILLVAQFSPPSQITAARRVAGFAKYLPRLGHSVTVLTSARSGDGSVEGAAMTVRTADLAATRLNWRGSAQRGIAPALPTGLPRGVERYIVPDMGLATWLPFALPKAHTLAARMEFDCVITTSPPVSAHMIGRSLQRTGARWIADFRDGWTFDPPRPEWPHEWERRLDAALESRVVTPADMVIGVTRPIVEDLRTRLNVDARLVSNGYDPEEPRDADSTVRVISPDRHSLVHTGRAGSAGRSPAVVLDAVKLLLAHEPDLAERLEVVFAGAVSPEETRLLADPALHGIARSVGTLPRPTVLALQRAANSLLVLAVGASGLSVATGKLFEYLTAGPPILVIGDGSEAARIVSETGTGIAAPFDDPRAVADAIARLVRGISVRRRPDAIQRYSWEILAGQAGELIDEVCGSRDPSLP